jgi:hypothetical protein
MRGNSSFLPKEALGGSYGPGFLAFFWFGIFTQRRGERRGRRGELLGTSGHSFRKRGRVTPHLIRNK